MVSQFVWWNMAPQGEEMAEVSNYCGLIKMEVGKKASVAT